MRRRQLRSVVLAVVLVLLLSSCTWIARASVSRTGGDANGGSEKPALDGDGRFLVFMSVASNLVANDTNGAADIFVRDNYAKTTQRVSVTSSGGQANGVGSEDPSISNDGRYVAFRSRATNLVSGDTNGVADVFVHDRQTGTTQRVTVSGGDQPRISGSGRYVVYVAPNFSVNVYDRDLGTTESLTSGTPRASAPDISDDGRYVVFQLVGGDTGPPATAELVDREANTSRKIPQDQIFAAGPVLSGDGRVVVVQTVESTGFDMFAYRLVAYDVSTGATQEVAVTAAGAPVSGGGWYGTDVSTDGRFVVFTTNDALTSADTNNGPDIYVRDMHAEKTFLVGADKFGHAPGDEFTGAISADGRYVAFVSAAPDIVGKDTNKHDDVFVRAMPEPNPTAVAPSTIARGGTTTVTITGSYFFADARVKISGTGVQVLSTTRVDENTVTADLAAASDAAPGTRNVTVSIPGTGPGAATGATGTCANCLTIS
jgi:Tol biopolymer transport system component